MQTLPCLAELPSPVLTERLYELRKQERALLVELLAYLAEVDRRKLYLELGFSSLFAFLTDHLGYTRSAAFRRSTAARLLARYPIVAEYLADGRLVLTTLVELREAFEVAPLQVVLDRAAGRTEDQVRELVAALRPRPEPIDLLRRLPTTTPPPVPPTPSSAGPALTADPPPISPPPPPAPAARPRIEPIAQDRHVLRVTVSSDFVTDLEAVRAALSHQIPDRDLEKVLHECLRRTLRDSQRRRRGGDRPRVTTTPRREDSRYIPADVRREVWRRDEGSCAFVGANGHRCGSTFQLQLHHIEPFARGGKSTASNLTVRCSRHNRFHADKDYGSEYMRRRAARA